MTTKLVKTVLEPFGIQGSVPRLEKPASGLHTQSHESSLHSHVSIYFKIHLNIILLYTLRPPL
jgi:hypothetical protein